MLTIKVYFSDGMVSEAYNINQLNHIKAEILDPEWIEQYGHCEITRLQVGLGDNWVKKTVLYAQSTVPDSPIKNKSYGDKLDRMFTRHYL